ncbi:hypothetical protein ACI68E_002151 [Malassezia pachydermatis]
MPSPSSAFCIAYGQLLAGERPWEAGDATSSRRSEKSNAGPRTRYFQDLLALPVDCAFLVDHLAPISPTDLLDERYASRTDNLTAIWKEALRTWAEDTDDPQRVCHAIDTLLALASALLPKPYTNYTLDVITLLAGRMEEVDDMFFQLMEALDDTLRRPVSPADTLRTRQQTSALFLALVLTACVSGTSLSAYMLHRDIFSASMELAQHRVSGSILSETALLAALLATAGHVHGTPQAAGLGLDSISSAVVSHVGFQPYVKRVREYASSPVMARFAHAFSVQAAQMVQVYQAVPSTMDAQAWGAGWWPWASRPAPPTVPTLPPPALCTILAIWVWTHSSHTFTQSMLVPRSGEPLIVTLCSLASYVLTHAASSARATTYAHTMLQIFLALLGPTDGRTTNAVQNRLLEDEEPASQAASKPMLIDRIRLCRDKSNPLPPHPKSGAKRPRRLLVSVLDNVTLFLKYNRSKRLDTSAFRTAFLLLQRSIMLCAQQQVRLEYDWMEVWRASLATIAFLVSRQHEFGSEAASVAQNALETLSLALVQSDRFLQSPSETHWLIYELARAQETLTKAAEWIAEPRNMPWALLWDVLQAVHTHMAQWREEAQTSAATSFFRRSHTNEPVSMHTILSMIQELDLASLLAPEKPACATIVRQAQSSSTRHQHHGVPSVPLALLRFIQQDILAMLRAYY